MQRLYFLTKTEQTCEEIEDSLVVDGVNPNRIFIFDNLSEEMVALPESNVWTRQHFIPTFAYGIILGGLMGFLAGVFRLWEDERLELNLIVWVAIAGAIAGGFLFKLAAGDEHQERVQEYRKTSELDGYLVVADVPQKLFHKLHAMVVARHPAKYLGAVSHSKL